MAEIDYYKVLGVPRNSGASQIKKRYQELAKQHHPDHQGDENSMVIINRAYEVLSNTTKRLEYDRLRSLAQKRRAATNTARKKTQTYSYRTSRKAETTNKEKVVVAIFIVILLVTMLGFH